MIINDARSKERIWYRVRGWIEIETMIMIPANWLDCERKGTEMTLVDKGSNQLQKRLKNH